ncbi:MAG: hypothetical protein HC906_19485 [Bacteroidales bacterium]|nr:hypothetical protein [Bacteroidales bacterium]
MDWHGRIYSGKYASSFDIRPVIFDTVPKQIEFKKLEEKEIEIRPNPASSHITIRFWEMPRTDVYVEIYNLSGQMMY